MACSCIQEGLIVYSEKFFLVLQNTKPPAIVIPIFFSQYSRQFAMHLCWFFVYFPLGPICSMRAGAFADLSAHLSSAPWPEALYKI